jgi:hypothetical protein
MRALLVSIGLTAILLTPGAIGQTIDGNVVGTVLDPSGASIPSANVELLNVATGVKSVAKTTTAGDYRFSNVPVGNYTITVAASNFTTASLKDVAVDLNNTTTANLTLQVGTVANAVDVTDAAVLLNTTTAQITNSYSARLATDLPMAADPTGGVLNLALLSAGVASSGGIGAGTGPSVGGQRPRENNFTIEGVDNNRKDITGPAALVPNDAVSEFTLLQNQYSAEFGHSAGGQFNIAIKSGTNDLHGSAYEYLQNRDLNAMDEIFKLQGVTTRPRYDNNRLGATVGGPILKNRLFYYGLFEYNPVGFSATDPGAYGFTTGAYAALSAMPGLNQTNLNILKQYLPETPLTSPYTSTINGVNFPVGPLTIDAPAYYNTYNWLTSIDYTLSQRDQLRGRFVSNRNAIIDSTANLPEFYSNRLTTDNLVSLSEFHTFQPSLLNELRLAYSRFNDNTPAPNINYPGLNAFPNIVLYDVGVQIGPDPNAPQATIQNNYQLSDNLSWIKGKHTLKFGVDTRDQISSTTFVQAQRGDYEYNNTQNFLLDQSPDFRAQRSIGTDLPYSGNAMAFYAFASDTWRVSKNLSLDLGLRYEYNGVSQSMKDQALNSVSNVPGVLSFFAPQSQKTNFAPRVGFAYSPGNRATTSIRGGFGIGYDPIFDNVGANVRPPQVSYLVTLPITTPTPGFLANGGITPSAGPTNFRGVTSGWLPNQELGYAMTWNLGVQHEFAKDYTLEVRYVGTKGVHLLEQTQLNRLSVVNGTNFLPTFLQQPSAAALNSLPVTLAQLSSVSNNPFAPYGFTNAITAYEPIGNSFYNGLATEFKKRFARRLLFNVAYTWSHLMDDSSAETNTTTLSPRRPQDFGNLQSEWASSALDRRHRLTATWLYETPWFDKAHNWLARNLLGNYQVSGTYMVESPEYVTPQGAVDANLNGDAATDRTIVNPNGVPGTGSAVSALKNSAGATVAYLAKNPTAEYIAAGKGALADAGRNTLPTPRINNWDINVSKAFAIRERTKLQFRADFYNIFNHAQYVPGMVDNVRAFDRSGVTNYLTPGNALFNQWGQVYSSNPRAIQLGARISF